MIDVLVVEDDFMVARIHRGFVDSVDGFRVVGTANCGEQALTAAAELQPDLVLLDLYLPDMFGLDVVPRLRTAGHDCDVMVISAAREAEAVRGAVRQGFGSVETSELVERTLRTADGTLSAAECALRVGISRVSARRYLEHLTVTGRAVVTLRYGQAGRPERRYHWQPS